MEKNTAIEIFNKQIKGLENLKTTNFEKWERDTRILIQKCFGDKSEQVEEFKEIYFFSPVGIDDAEVWFENGVNKAKNILKSMVSEIELYWEDKENCLEGISQMNDYPTIYNPIFKTRKFKMCKNLIFVLAPFSDPYNIIFTDHIKKIVESNGFSCLRADNIFSTGPVMEDVWIRINEAQIIISELTGKNPNVFYETGIAHTIGKNVILITQEIEDVPFDLRHLRCIKYDYTPRGCEKLEEQIKNSILYIKG